MLWSEHGNNLYTKCQSHFGTEKRQGTDTPGSQHCNGQEEKESGAGLPTAVSEATKNRFCSGQEEKESGAGLPTAVSEATKNRFWQRTFQQRPEATVHKIPKAPKQCR